MQNILRKDVLGVISLDLFAVLLGGATALLPIVLGQLGGYDLTYGSLAGVVVMLLFFFVIGLGLVFGAHLNAALAEPVQPGVEDVATVETGEATAA